VVTAKDVATATIDGFTIEGGAANGSGNDNSGGGILLACASTATAVVVSRCEISGNSCTSFGGGIGMENMCDGLTATVTDCSIHDNVAGDHAGGMFCGGPCTVTGTTFTANSAGVGGGLGGGGSLLTLTGSTFVDNASTSDGGGVYLLSFASGSTLSDLIFNGNRAGGIGGALSGGGGNGSMTVSNGLFVGNAASAGGAISDDSATGFVCIACTITGNLATSQGQAILWQNSQSVGAPRLFNTILWGNPSALAEGGSEVSPATWSLVGTSHSDVGGYGGTDASTIDASPLFVASPAFFDRTPAGASAAGVVPVAATAGYTVGDTLEIGGDGVARTVSAVDAALGTVTFSPALAAAAAKGTQIRDWGAVASVPALDLHLTAASPCAGTGDPSVAPADNLDGDPTPSPPDMGAY
jgi:hypothetical protein